MRIRNRDLCLILAHTVLADVRHVVGWARYAWAVSRPPSNRR